MVLLIDSFLPSMCEVVSGRASDVCVQALCGDGCELGGADGVCK